MSQYPYHFPNLLANDKLTGQPVYEMTWQDIPIPTIAMGSKEPEVSVGDAPSPEDATELSLLADNGSLSHGAILLLGLLP